MRIEKGKKMKEKEWLDECMKRQIELSKKQTWRGRQKVEE